MVRSYKRFAIPAIFCLFIASSAFAQQGDNPQVQSQEAAASEAMAPAAPADTAASQPAKEAVPASKQLNIYGEVQGVNAQAGSMTVQYYDYDTDEEKTIELAVPKDAKIENVSALSDIKKGDWADITYSADGSKNTAKSITVEKEEEVPAETMPEGETSE